MKVGDRVRYSPPPAFGPQKIIVGTVVDGISGGPMILANDGTLWDPSLAPDFVEVLPRTMPIATTGRRARSFKAGDSPASSLGTEADAGDMIWHEVVRTRAKHGVEAGNGDKRLRILTEEVGEVARALDDVEQAEIRRDLGARTQSTPWLEGAREAVQDARKHVLEEVVQVAATAFRWAAAELATEQQRTKLTWDATQDDPPVLQARAIDLHHSQGVQISEVIAAAEADKVRKRKIVNGSGTIEVVTEDAGRVRVRVRETHGKASIFLTVEEVWELIGMLKRVSD